MPKTAAAQDVLDFWFDESKLEQWYKKDPAFDETIRVAIDALTDPVRICLVAATYWFCVDQVRARQPVSAGLEPDHHR